MRELLVRVFGGPARALESRRHGPPKQKVSTMTLSFPNTYAKAQLPLKHIIREGRMEVTPALAERILTEAKYEKQRKAFPHHIALLADSMRRDLWTAGSQIAFVYYDGRLYLVNGQHRMYAVIESGRAIEFQVLIEEASSEKEVSAIYYRFDVQQRQRSLSEVLNATDIAATYKISKTLANATFKAAGIIANRMEIPNYQKDPIKARSVDSRLDAARHWWGVAARFGEMIEPAPESVRNRLRNPGILAVALMTIRYQPEKAEEFWKGLAENDGLRKGDPRQTLINDLMVRHMGSGRQGQGIIVAANAWSAFYEGRAIRHLKVSANAVVRIAGTPFDGRRR